MRRLGRDDGRTLAYSRRNDIWIISNRGARSKTPVGFEKTAPGRLTWRRATPIVVRSRTAPPGTPTGWSRSARFFLSLLTMATTAALTVSTVAAFDRAVNGRPKMVTAAPAIPDAWSGAWEASRRLLLLANPRRSPGLST